MARRLLEPVHLDRLGSVPRHRFHFLTFAEVGAFTPGTVPVNGAVLWQVQPYVENWTSPADNRTPRIALADLIDHAAPSSSGSSSSGPPATGGSTGSSGSPGSTGSSAPDSASSTSSSPSAADPSTDTASSSSGSSSASSTVGTISPTSPSSIGTTSIGTTWISTTSITAPPPTLPYAPTTDTRALAAAHWLGEQLANAPNGLFGNVDFPDYGLTVDALLALAAAGVGGDLIAATATKIENSGEDYIGAPDETASNFARIAKTALALQVAGLDPTAFPSADGPRNLIADLRGTLNADGSFGGSDFPFVHALAIYALARTPEGVPAAAISWLQGAQCTTAGNDNFGAYGYGGTDPCSGVDGDGTALAIQALAAGGVPTSGPSIKDAAAYLTSIQGANGGVPSSFGGINTNNTGLAAQALDRVQLAPSATARMATFVSTLQVQCATLENSGDRFSSKDLGAIAYLDDGGFDSPITTPDFDNRDQWIRASTQAVLAYHLPSFDRITAVGAQSTLPAAPTCAPVTTSSAPPSATPTGATPTTPTAATTPLPGGGTSSAAPFPGSISLSADTVAAGGSITVTVIDSLIEARHRVDLHSAPVLLGTFITGDTGDGSLTVRIPAGTAAGRHEIVVTAGGFVVSAGIRVTAPTRSSPAAAAAPTSIPATTVAATTTAGPITTPVDDAGRPLPNTGVSEGLRTLLITGGLLLLLGVALLMLSRRRGRSGAPTHLS
ncbi:MAG: prenyltransferase/squalene oxidase repeat-containing protein [Nakamurella sp.]